MRMARLVLLPFALVTALAATASAQPRPLPPRPLPPGPAAPLPPGPPGASLSYVVRMHDFEARMKLRKLTAVEQHEYDTLKIEQARYVAQLAETERKAEETRAARRAEAMRLALVAYPNLYTVPIVRQEFQVHAYRAAVLERLRAVAAADGRTDLYPRIDGLVARENARHETWLLAHRGGR